MLCEAARCGLDRRTSAAARTALHPQDRSASGGRGRAGFLGPRGGRASAPGEESSRPRCGAGRPAAGRLVRRGRRADRPERDASQARSALPESANPLSLRGVGSVSLPELATGWLGGGTDQQRHRRRACRGPRDQQDGGARTSGGGARAISAAVAKGEIALAGFGKFSVSRRGARPGRNPRSGEPIVIGPSARVRFRAAKALKDRLAAQ